MVRFFVMIGFFAATLFAAAGCLRDGYVCQSDSDCFGGETCLSGTCVAADGMDAGPDADCRPASDESLCQAQEPCVSDLTVTDSCGTVRTITCDCSCVPDTVDEICQANQVACGMLTATDRCGSERSVPCGTCEAPEECVDNVCTPCVDPVCPQTAECGGVSNGCGDVVSCGSPCTSGELCVDNACVDPVLQPDSLSEGDRFGDEVERNNAFLVVGAPGTDVGIHDDAGKIFVFRQLEGGWQLHQEIENPNPAPDDAFGAIFDIRDDWLVVVGGDSVFSFRKEEDDTFSLIEEATGQPTIVAVTLADQDRLVIGIDTDDPDQPSIGISPCSATGCGGFGQGWLPPQTFEVGPVELGAALDAEGAVIAAGAPGDHIEVTNPERPEGALYLLTDQSVGPIFKDTEWSGGLAFYDTSDHGDYPNDDVTLRSGTTVAIHEEGFVAYAAPDASPEIGNAGTGEYFILSPRFQRPYTEPNRYIAPVNTSYAGCGRSITFAGSDTFFTGCVSRFERGDPDRPDFADDWSRGRFFRYTYDRSTLTWLIDPVAVQPPNVRDFDQFGYAMDGKADFLAVGAPGRDNDTGAVFIYTSDTWAAE